jgi:chlorophyllide a reductase subunit Y
MTAKAVSEMSFEEAMAALEGVVGALEKGEVALEQSIALYERGAALKAHCAAKLRDAEVKVELIRAQEGRAVGTTPVVQKGKELGIPSLYFTNLISARPLMGPAGAGSLGQVVNAAMANKDRMDHMREFFEGVGEGDTAGIWEGAPNLRPDFRAAHQKKLDKAARAAKAEEMI